MRKYIIFLIIIILSFLFYPREKYLELNNLAIIDQIEINCSLEYKFSLREIIPVKSNNSLEYKYKKIIFTGDNLSSIKNKIAKYSKKIYLKHIKVYKSNCSNDKLIFKFLSIKPKKIKKIEEN